MAKAIGVFRGLILDTKDFGSSVDFYTKLLGNPKFVDGNKWAPFGAADGASLSLAGSEENTGKGVAIAIKVSDLAAAVSQIEALGGVKVGEIQAGAHENKCLFNDPDGNALMIYESA